MGARSRCLALVSSQTHTRSGGVRREDRLFRIALLEEVLEEFPGVVLNLDIKRTAPVVAPTKRRWPGCCGGSGVPRT